jgi:hypothetical protein
MIESEQLLQKPHCSVLAFIYSVELIIFVCHCFSTDSIELPQNYGS